MPVAGELERLGVAKIGRLLINKKQGPKALFFLLPMKYQA